MKQKGTLTISNPTGTGNVSFTIAGEPVSQGETWVINESPSITMGKRLYGDFISNGKQYVAIGFDIDYERDDLFGYATQIEAMSSHIDWVYSYGWKNQAYRTVTFETAPTGDLLTWLQANAVKQ